MSKRAYSPQGLIEPDPDYELCCGIYHTTAAAKFFAIYYFVFCLVISGLNFMWFGADKGWFSLFCLIFTIYCCILMYGVFLEKTFFLIPFLAINGFVSIALILFSIFVLVYGTFTNAVETHHKESSPLRDLYQMHSLDPDDEKTQTIVSSAFLFLLLLTTLVFIYSWYVILRLFQCIKTKNRTWLPGEHVRGIIADETGDEQTHGLVSCE
ncbi:hypothetical protein WR25_17847 [Diploscapter pachys]|uniref:Uncharacterized protein n=1 Tax=Diploscapter pachys TaxID=2018661 RepID=A0A2A2JM05_9BILA|nr:hypothetical protein WR25_17847 [Diploscapter pachys]